MSETGNERSFCQNLENIFIFKIFFAQGHFLNTIKSIFTERMISKTWKYNHFKRHVLRAYI